ncbi:MULTISPECIES: hypothetical protein [Paenibacillus]|uniref:Uncharacterized protein n=1 Tax=Paenibacillus naphthalenovorans TaxID=162209 RepID=A0A0U2N101_9BACL|nr:MULTISPECIES: hypothetical protein [Paenibacillus]ALS24591.1 hypothetical protein IJ22_43050 [Paenibacillus naphthalenovorans]NTZ16053.1 hypothetical protein [Paenibacillus sp. JMULE4]GCL74668.1 hypothetical protein PN4B1_46380 [Paenibacillus naphthalenovorans]SDJ43706.1 hypothetical protein SAMN05421868_12728 [Paenibacillus naphthalenovorans]
MRYKYTLILTIIGAALCLIHYIGHEYDPIYLLFYSLSVPAWFYPIFTYTDVNPLLLYFLTTLSWTVMGYVIDRFSIYRQSRSQ